MVKNIALSNADSIFINNDGKLETSNLKVNGNVDITIGNIDGTTIGSTVPVQGSFTTINASSGVTVGGNIDANKDNNGGKSQFGNAMVGHAGSSDSAAFYHKDFFNTAGFAIQQYAANRSSQPGDTILNAGSTSKIQLRNGFSNPIYYDGTNLDMNTKPIINYTSSDDRLKHNEVVVNNGLDTIRLLQPKFYKKTKKLLNADYNGDLDAEGIEWGYETGLIAQDIKNIEYLSHLVTLGDGVNIDGEFEERPYCLRYNDLFVYNIAATKELDKKLQDQQELINSLITRIETLENN